MQPLHTSRQTNIEVDKETSGSYDIDSLPEVLFPTFQAHIPVLKEAEWSGLPCSQLSIFYFVKYRERVFCVKRASGALVLS